MADDGRGRLPETGLVRNVLASLGSGGKAGRQIADSLNERMKAWWMRSIFEAQPVEKERGGVFMRLLLSIRPVVVATCKGLKYIGIKGSVKF